MAPFLNHNLGFTCSTQNTLLHREGTEQTLKLRTITKRLIIQPLIPSQRTVVLSCGEI